MDNKTGSNENNIDYYNNFIIFNFYHLNRAFLTTVIFIWSVYFVLSRPAQTQQPPVIKCIIISSRGIGITLLFISMALEIIAELIAFGNSNFNTSTNILTGTPLIATLILWNSALALKSVALFIALTRYAPLTKTLSKEPIMPKFQYSCCNCFNLISGLIVYPVLYAVIIISISRWETALAMSQLFFLFQLIIAEIMFIILNKRMSMALDEGLLVGRNAILQVRKLRSRNWFIIVFIFMEICSISVYTVDYFTKNVIRTNFAATVFLFGIMSISSALLFGAIALILCPVSPHSRFSCEGTTTNSTITYHVANHSHSLNNINNFPNYVTDKEREENNNHVSHSQPSTSTRGFTSFRLKNYFQKYNHSEPLSFIFPKRSSQITLDQNQINKDNPEDHSCASSINDKSNKRFSTNSAIIINKIIVHKQESSENPQEIKPLESVILAS
ncbi:10655_t:CDS:1 [Scutellospora calospora]|uniref:10655_t:CDS:1 n=1 Tax=Scutellospora calospora TaxID=85575 RepID=A0ACA9KAN4_9GLOM|nr:10655_t:CDS:1 [Scutellospora calospora]